MNDPAPAPKTIPRWERISAGLLAGLCAWSLGWGWRDELSDPAPFFSDGFTNIIEAGTELRKDLPGNVDRALSKPTVIIGGIGACAFAMLALTVVLLPLAIRTATGRRPLPYRLFWWLAAVNGAAALALFSLEGRFISMLIYSDLPWYSGWFAIDPTIVHRMSEKFFFPTFPQLPLAVWVLWAMKPQREKEES